jgi:hypothetical protein
VSRRNGDIYASTKFTPRQYELLKRLSEDLRITFSGAVEFALEPGLVPLARGVVFFKQRIEASPGSRLACEDVWAAFVDWCCWHKLKGQISESDFAYMVLEICRLKEIAVRARGNQVFCLDVRLRQVPDRT